MAILLSARLRRNQARLHTLRFDPTSETGELELLEILVATLEDLQGLYPDYTPEGARYALLQHLAVLDLQHQAQLESPLFLTHAVNWDYTRQAPPPTSKYPASTRFLPTPTVHPYACCPPYGSWLPPRIRSLVQSNVARVAAVRAGVTTRLLRAVAVADDSAPGQGVPSRGQYLFALRPRPGGAQLVLTG
ncbi:hypothetical protein [Hymenobacter sp. YC55]|uniref:hypothetical protein n=1 Tax=Hymenobacter sp. YC55 TaxID=3034019 RepID=UPI0023F9A037|nr:hypothetical protein [Hymenobacter sp. YC55]MDF7815131.1 hypothetical protein [Hymenobacter sp. YC55]